MNIFEQLKDIIEVKSNQISDDIETEKDFVPYMTQRWLSFYSNEFAAILNSSTNVIWKALDDKQLWYKLFTCIIPKSKSKNIKYIKKNKEKKDVKLDEDVIIYLAESKELSKKEIKEYMQSGLVDIKSIKKQLESN